MQSEDPVDLVSKSWWAERALKFGYSAEANGYSERSAGVRVPEIVKLVTKLAGAKASVLDLPSGNGMLGAAMPDLSRYVAVDFSGESLALVRSRDCAYETIQADAFSPEDRMWVEQRVQKVDVVVCVGLTMLGHVRDVDGVIDLVGWLHSMAKSGCIVGFAYAGFPQDPWIVSFGLEVVDAIKQAGFKASLHGGYLPHEFMVVIR